MRLIYTATRQPVAIGDRHTVDGFELVVAHAPRPHKPDSEGKINFNIPDGTSGPVFYCSVIGAEWIEREDRGEAREPSPATSESAMTAADRLDILCEAIDKAGDLLAVARSELPALSEVSGFWGFVDNYDRARETLKVLSARARALAPLVLPYNTIGHVCQSTRRIAMTVSDAFARDDSSDRVFWVFRKEDAAMGLDPWRRIDGIDATRDARADGRPVSYTLHFTGSRTVDDIGPAYMVYMQRTKAEINAKAIDKQNDDTGSQHTLGPHSEVAA